MFDFKLGQLKILIWLQAVKRKEEWWIKITRRERNRDILPKRLDEDISLNFSGVLYTIWVSMVHQLIEEHLMINRSRILQRDNRRSMLMHILLRQVQTPNHLRNGPKLLLTKLLALLLLRLPIIMLLCCWSELNAHLIRLIRYRFIIGQLVQVIIG